MSVSFGPKRGSFGSKRGRWKITSTATEGDPAGEDMGKQTGKNRSSTATKRLSETSKGSERSRSRGSFFGSFSMNSSDHTGLTDPVSSVSDDGSRRRKLKKKKKRRRLRLGKLFGFGETELQQKKDVNFIIDCSPCNGEETTDTHNLDSFELGLSQDDIAGWVRKQRTKCVERNAVREFRSKQIVQEIRRSSRDVTEDTLELDDVSPLTRMASSDSMLMESNSSLSSEVQLFQEQPMTTESTNGDKQMEAVAPVKTPSWPDKPSSGQQLQATRTIRLPRKGRRPKTELDITGHNSFSDDNEEKSKSHGRKKSKSKESSSSRSVSSESEPINGLRRYPSKKGQRKAKRNSAGSTGSNSNRVDFAGRMSTSNSFEAEAADEEISSTIVDELTRLRSLVDLMVTRMELYEQQSDGIPQGNPAVNRKSKMAKEGDVEENSDKQKPKKKKSKKKSKTDHQSPGTTTREENVDKWISKLEKMKKVYEERLDWTTNHLETLKENQALTNKLIIADYQQRLEAKNKKPSQTKERPPKIQKKKAEQQIDSTDRSKSCLSSRSTAKSAEEESSLCDSSRIDDNAETDESAHSMSTRSDRSVRFNSTVQVATCLSRHEMNPKEKFDYWSGDGDEEMSDDLLKMLMQKWTVRKRIEDVESELIARKKEDKNLLGEDTPLPSHLVSDCIKQRLPTSEREGSEGYTYTIGIQD